MITIQTFLLLMVGTGAPATLEKLPDSSEIIEGKEVVLKFNQPGIEVKAKYRENAYEKLQHTQEIGKTSANGVLRWTPYQAGVVALSWEDGGEKNVSVLHDGAPLSGTAVMLVAGIILLGGTVRYFMQMLKQR